MDNFMSPKETAKYLTDRNVPVTEMTLSRWREKGISPSFNKIGGRFFYSINDIESLIEKSKVS